METMYFVSWYIHNKTGDAWNATIVDKYNDLSAAKKSYHEQLAMYINGEDFDSVVVLLTDSYGNKLMGEWWTNYVAPEPPEPNEKA